MIKIIPNKESVYSEEISLNNRIYNNSVNFINSLCTEDENWISHPSHCLISITPIKFKEKLSLFGGKIRVMTSNKITIYKAMISKNDRSIYEKGSMLFEFYISDESLMDAVIGSNSNPSPCTISNILSNAQNYQSGNKQETSVEKALSDIKGDMQEVSNFTSEFKSFIDDVISKGRVLKKDRDSFVTSLKAAIGNLPSNCAYVIKTLEKNLEKDLNSFEIEILSTLKKISSIKNEEDFLMIENNLKDNYLQWVIDGEFSIDESKSLLKLYKSIRSTGSEETIKKVDHMISLFQKIINGKRMPLNKTDGAMEIHRISGGIKCFGQENNDNDYFEISFGQGVQSSDSSYYLSMVNKFLNLNITKTNLMSLIRGVFNC